jgi:hypothetical protein
VLLQLAHWVGGLAEEDDKHWDRIEAFVAGYGEASKLTELEVSLLPLCLRLRRMITFLHRVAQHWAGHASLADGTIRAPSADALHFAQAKVWFGSVRAYEVMPRHGAVDSVQRRPPVPALSPAIVGVLRHSCGTCKGIKENKRKKGKKKREPQMYREEEAKLVVVDLRDRQFYDRKLMRRFYDELMLPAFGKFEDELESFDSWVEQLDDPPTDAPAVHLHILLVMVHPSSTLAADASCPRPNAWHEVAPGAPPPISPKCDSGSLDDVVPAEGARWWDEGGVAEVEIVGGTACEYYPESNCGLLTYAPGSAPT